MTPEALAVIWLTSLIGLGIVYFWQLFRRSDYDAWESCLYLPTYVLGRLLWRVHFKNQAPAVLRRGAVLAANHRSSVDPFFVQLAARRRVHWMVAKEFCQHVVFGPLLSALQVIPTNRSGMDTASTKAAMRITKAGRLVGMFPEGRINTTPRALLPLRSGAALVAIRSQVPIVPLWIEGSPAASAVWKPLFIPARVAITFGNPIWPSQAGNDHNEPAGPQPADADRSEKKDSNPRHSLTESDALIVEWGTQIMMLAERAGTPVELASQRRLRNRT